MRSRKSPQASPAAVPRGSLHSLRAVILESSDDPAVWTAKATSTFSVFSAEAVGLRLDATLQSSSEDCWVKLSKDSVEAMSGVNKESQPAEPIAAKKPKTAAAGKIEPKLGNFTRSKKGKQLMEEQVGRLLWLDGVKFDSNAHIVYTLSPK